MTILSIFSNKGGVGKTSAAVNLACLSAKAGHQTLLCDLDPQGSSSFYFKVKPKIKPKARGLANKGKALNHSIKKTSFNHLDILPADFSHRNLDVQFSNLKHSKKRLQRILKPLSHTYEIIMLDCPPTINLLAENVFTVSDRVLVPVVPTTLSLRAYEQMESFFKEQSLSSEKLLPFLSMVDLRKSMHREYSSDLPFSVTNLMKTAIPYRSQVEKMGMNGEPLVAVDSQSDASRAYQNLWKEIEEELHIGVDNLESA